MTHAVEDFQNTHSSIVAAVEDGCSYSSSRQVLSAVCDKVFECTEYCVDGNSSSADPQSFPADFLLLVAQNCHGAPVVQKIVLEVGAKATDTRTQCNPHVVSTDNSCGLSFLTPQGIPVRSALAFSKWQSITQWFQSQAAQGYKSWSHDMTNVSIPEVNMLKNSSTLALHMLQ